MLILGIETSCDETAAAVVRDGHEILSNAVVSQIDIFAEYGGVIPEVAARSHLEVMMPVVDKALSDAAVTWDEIDTIAVTHAPGLLGSLLIGTLTARTLAILHDKPLYAVHHLKSHIYANWLDSGRGGTGPITVNAKPSMDDANKYGLSMVGANSSASRHTTEPPAFPLLALVISGGHTQILYMPAHNQFKIIGTTKDDAVGECFDKVAKILGLPYPGGPSIAQAASAVHRLGDEGPAQAALVAHPLGDTPLATLADSPHLTENVATPDPDRYKLPHPKVDGLDFSFSGLKTAVLRAVQQEVGVPISYPSHQLKDLLTPRQVADFAASFQKTAVEILLEKLSSALQLHPETKSVVFAGGVSANRELRARALTTYSLPCYFPAPSLSGDNGAMVAAAAYFEIISGVQPTDPYALNIYPRISIEGQ